MSLDRVIVLDRDGVLNKMVYNSEHGLIDSPMVKNQVEILPDVPRAIRIMSKAGYRLIIATNQPAARKGKTTDQNLQEVHQEVLNGIQLDGGKIDKSFISPYLKEDNHPDRKPGVGMLERAFGEFPNVDLSNSWMVADGATDILCGKNFGLQTAFVGPKKPEIINLVDEFSGMPDYWCSSLIEFAYMVADIDEYRN